MFTNVPHGRTMGALLVTANDKDQAPFVPFVPGVHTADASDICSVEKTISPRKTCAVIIEPIQGKGVANTVDA